MRDPYDKPEDIVNLALDALDEKTAHAAPPTPKAPPQADALKVAYAARALQAERGLLSGTREPPAASTSERMVSSRKKLHKRNFGCR